MGFAVWLCALCLHASLLPHALGCSGVTQGEPCVSGATADGQYDDQKQQMAPPLTEGRVLFRRRRQLDRRGPAHPGHANVPGAVSVKGFPNALIQADRSRRQAANRKRNVIRNIPRVGSYSLLNHDKKSNPLQVTRAKRQVKAMPPKRDSSSRSGAFSVLGDPLNDGRTDPKKAY
ncbi:uncharacterized protein si:dkey-12l12.1 [Betta splendens]|uniref:Uncharacterized protein si:dkey-12l12.1 n=1 Tax=Betta splendens TaxID=158456 RepID=A0A8M1HDP8_BETSP|nr:uncharacterized protein si:dkey-12l12.1 [Betta splendens]